MGGRLSAIGVLVVGCSGTTSAPAPVPAPSASTTAPAPASAAPTEETTRQRAERWRRMGVLDRAGADFEKAFLETGDATLLIEAMKAYREGWAIDDGIHLHELVLTDEQFRQKVSSDQVARIDELSDQLVDLRPSGTETDQGKSAALVEQARAFAKAGSRAKAAQAYEQAMQVTPRLVWCPEWGNQLEGRARARAYARCRGLLHPSAPTALPPNPFMVHATAGADGLVAYSGWSAATTLYDLRRDALALVLEEKAAAVELAKGTLAMKSDAGDVIVRRGNRRSLIPPSGRFMALSPEGNHIAVTRPSDDEVAFYRLTAVADERWSHAATEKVSAVAASAAGQRVAVGYANGEVLLLDGKSGAVTHRLGPHTGSVTALAFDETGQRLASASGDLEVWSVDSGASIDTFDLDGKGRCIRFAVGEVVVFTDGMKEIHRRDLKAKTTRVIASKLSFVGDIASADFVDDHTVTLTHYKSSSVELVDTRTGESRILNPGANDIEAASHPGAKRLVFSVHERLRVVDADTGLTAHRIKLPKPARSIQFNGKGDLVYVDHIGGQDTIVDVAAGEVRKRWAPKGELAALTDVSVVEAVEGGKLAFRLLSSGYDQAVVQATGAQASPRGRTVAVGMPLRFVSVLTGKVVKETDRMVIPLAFSPDGRLLLTIDGDQVLVWEVDENRPYNSFVSPLIARASVVRLLSGDRIATFDGRHQSHLLDGHGKVEHTWETHGIRPEHGLLSLSSHVFADVLNSHIRLRHVKNGAEMGHLVPFEDATFYVQERALGDPGLIDAPQDKLARFFALGSSMSVPAGGVSAAVTWQRYVQPGLLPQLLGRAVPNPSLEHFDFGDDDLGDDDLGDDDDW